MHLVNHLTWKWIFMFLKTLMKVTLSKGFFMTYLYKMYMRLSLCFLDGMNHVAIFCNSKTWAETWPWGCGLAAALMAVKAVRRRDGVPGSTSFMTTKDRLAVSSEWYRSISFACCITDALVEVNFGGEKTRYYRQSHKEPRWWCWLMCSDVIAHAHFSSMCDDSVRMTQKSPQKVLSWCHKVSEIHLNLIITKHKSFWGKQEKCIYFVNIVLVLTLVIIIIISIFIIIIISYYYYYLYFYYYYYYHYHYHYYYYYYYCYCYYYYYYYYYYFYYLTWQEWKWIESIRGSWQHKSNIFQFVFSDFHDMQTMKTSDSPRLGFTH